MYLILLLFIIKLFNSSFFFNSPCAIYVLSTPEYSS